MGDTNKKKYFEVKEYTKKTVLQATCKTERNRFEVVNQTDNQKSKTFKIIKNMVKRTLLVN